MFYIQQANNRDCGFTCLKILLANIHHDRNYLFFKTPFFDEDVSFFSLIKEANEYHLELVALKAINKEEISTHNNFPIIARVIINDMYHAVYVYKSNKKYVYYYDPGFGFKKVRVDEFTTIWTGELLSVKDYTKAKCPVSRPN